MHVMCCHGCGVTHARVLLCAPCACGDSTKPADIARDGWHRAELERPAAP